MSGPGAAAMFATLLDRTVAEVAETAADARHFDRNRIAWLADIWDNNTLPFFAVALARPGWARDRLARRGLRWMAAAGPQRREWMVAAAGPAMDELLPPAVAAPEHFRDHAGVLLPGPATMTTERIALLDEDYDLARAAVRGATVERAGRTLAGLLEIVVPRRYDGPPVPDDARLRIVLRDVRSVVFDSADGAGARVTTDGVRIGERGRFACATVVVRPVDDTWHLSRAGRLAALRAPTRGAVPREIGAWRVRGDALAAATALHRAMLRIRSVGHPHLAGDAGLPELCRALDGAGGRVLSAADRPSSARGAAFRRLAAEWAEPPPSGDRAFPARAQLMVVGWTAAHTRYTLARDAEATVTLAVPDDAGRWTPRTEAIARPHRMAVRTSAFTGPHAVSGAAGGPVTLGDGALTIE